MEGRINVRFYSLNEQKLKKSLLHNFRLRKDLQNVDYSRSDENIYSHDPENFRHEIERAEHEHGEFYQKLYKRSLRRSRVNSIVEGVITFPRIYQTYYEEGKISKDALVSCFEEFKTRYEEESGVKILGSAWHFEEQTFHVHWWATNYEVAGENAGRHFNPAGWKSYSQDVAGHAFRSLGLSRGIKKENTRAQHERGQAHYERILDESAKLEELLKDGVSVEEIEELIKLVGTPLKTLLTYVKRSMNEAKEADYIIQQQQRAMNKFREIFPNVENVEGFADLLDFIKETQNTTKNKNHTPRMK